MTVVLALGSEYLWCEARKPCGIKDRVDLLLLYHASHDIHLTDACLLQDQMDHGADPLDDGIVQEPPTRLCS